MYEHKNVTKACNEFNTDGSNLIHTNAARKRWDVKYRVIANRRGLYAENELECRRARA